MGTVGVVVFLWILLGWAVLAVLTAVVFCAVGRAARREDERLGYDQADPPTVARGGHRDTPTSGSRVSV